MELTNPNESIEPIQVDSLIWSDQQQKSAIHNQTPFRLYTASKSLKNAFLHSHIKPDYGSLGQFMRDVGISKDILLHNRKKKLDQQQDIQQKKMRTTLRGKNLQKVIRQDGPALEKTIASKMIVENLFEKNFGNTISNFCSQNNRQDSNKNSYCSISSLSDILDQLMTKQKKDSEFQGQSKHQLPVLSRNKNQFSSKEVRVVGQKEKIEKIREIKAFYPSLKKYIIEESNTNYTQMNNNKGIFQVNKFNSNFTLIAQSIRQAKIEDIHSIKISNTTISDQLICFLLDFFTHIRNSNIYELTIENIQLGSNELISGKVRQFIQRSNVNRIALNKVGLKSRDFCIVCLGVGTKLTFDYFSIRNNQIGELAKKCLDVLMKFNKNTQFDFTGNPIEKELKNKHGYKRCFVFRQ